MIKKKSNKSSKKLSTRVNNTISNNVDSLKNKKISINMGLNDRVIRILASVLFFALALTKNQWWLVPGIIFLVTGMVGWCPLYQPFGINTNKKE